MKNKLVMGILGIFLVFGSANAFAEAISIEDYEAKSSAPVDRSNAQELLRLVNALLDKIGVNYVRVTSGARSWGGADTHQKSNAIDLGWDSALYEKIKRNIAGSGLRLELIEGIRQEGQADHIHLDTVNAGGGRTFMP